MVRKKYNIIYADPPWKYDNEKSNNPAMGGMTYPTMSQKELCALPVSSIAATDCVLFLWVTMPKLPEGIEVLRAWRFRYITTPFTWLKVNRVKGNIYSGMGHWTNGNQEIVLLGKKGRPNRIAKNVKQVVVAPKSRHSAKPDEIRIRIETLMGKLPRVELFARQKTRGWDAIGNDIDGQDIREVLAA